ncbi:hypothetical protein SLS56_008137 [Neofusicoccum ribis]|uniref:Uncharacterized protein n=1 Tax=Neofusicoccum ribis TaxID=45134 RepID=A0ABR3SL22_9PEZI
MNRNHHASHLALHHARKAAAADAAAELDLNVLIPVEQEVSGPSKTLHARDASPVIAARSEETSKGCSSSRDSDTCQKPTDSSTAIILAAIVPIAIAIIVLVFLHRRHMKKQALEDLNDKHKSLDFGLGEPPKTANGKAPEMSVVDVEKEIRKGGRGMSMDMETSPYLMPGGVQDSRESFHSMSRISDNHDPYRPVTFVKDDTMSLRSASKFNDGMSTYSKSSVGTDRMGLLKNAQRMSRSSPLSPEDRTIPEIQFPEPSHVKPPPSPSSASPISPDGSSPDLTRDAYGGNEKRRSLNADSKRTSVQEPTLPQISEDNDAVPQPVARKPNPLRLESMVATVHNPQTDSIISRSSDYGDGFRITPPSPGLDGKAANRMSVDVVNAPSTPPQGLAIQAPKPNRISMSLRPLPVDDPTENPEERANRIRSFYKEYFDDSKPEPVGRYDEQQEDYGQEYMEGAIFDPDKGHFVVGGQPFAEPVTRRAMTPPPRAPPRFRGHGPPGGSMGGSRPMTPGSMRSGTPLSMPRGNSAMSFRGPPKKPLPPPTTLSSLPTPAALKEDSHIFNPIDFAPPPTFRDMQAGRRPDSPLGVERPYSPSVRPHTPLMTAFDELAVIPSPHALRKSGTFTSLDFTAPPRFKGVDNGSDAASVRSGGSGISAAQLHAVRAGAYRVSRIPKGMVGTRDDLMTSLKPTWDLRDTNTPQQVKPGM